MATITIDHLYRNGTKQEGNVGDGATILMYSDTLPATVIARTGNTITVQEDSHEIASGTWPDFQYTYQRNAGGTITRFWWSERKGWRNNGNRLLIGNRRYYQDPTF